MVVRLFTARKGLRTGIIADRIGGQVNDTAGIENFITVKQTTGSEFSSNLADHIAQYDIDAMTGIRATNIEKQIQLFVLHSKIMQYWKQNCDYFNGRKLA